MQELDARTPQLPSPCLYIETVSPSFLHSFSTSWDYSPPRAAVLQRELISSLSKTTFKSFPDPSLPRQGVPSLPEAPCNTQWCYAHRHFPLTLLFVDSIHRAFTHTSRWMMQMSQGLIPLGYLLPGWDSCAC